MTNEYNLKELVNLMWKYRREKSFKKKGLTLLYRQLIVKGSIGMTGELSKIPWISYLAKGQENKNGIYPVILFYGTDEFLEKLSNSNVPKRIVLSFGISANKRPSTSWGTVIENKKTIGDLFVELGYATKDNGAKNYNKSYVYKVYDWTDDVDFDVIQKDVDDLIDIYLKVLNIENTDKMVSDGINKPSQGVKKFVPIQKIFFGTPGGGKSKKVKRIIEEEKQAKDRLFRTAFHPDTDYASFVGGYKPVMKGNEIVYTYVPQVFTLAYIAAWNDQNNDYYLDIEEINRGNCAQIFGDLFQLLDRNNDTGESEFPVRADADLCDYLMNGKDNYGNYVLKNKNGIEKGELRLPSNLSIVATMNTSDQSLFPMDSAFKRRWDWEYVPSSFEQKYNFNITIGENTYKWHNFLKKVNEFIKQVTDSEDKQMGSFFVKSDMNEERFKSKVMFYLWSEICKDEYKTQNNFFRYNKSANEQIEFTFNELYGPDSIKILQLFMEFLEVSPIKKGNEPENKDEDFSKTE